MYLSNKIVINELKQRQSTCRRSIHLFLLLRTSLVLAVFANVPICTSQETKAMVSSGIFNIFFYLNRLNHPFEKKNKKGERLTIM